VTQVHDCAASATVVDRVIGAVSTAAELMVEIRGFAFGTFIDLANEPIAVVEYGPDGASRTVLSDQLGRGRLRGRLITLVPTLQN
jgi:hypothetical protein